MENLSLGLRMALEYVPPHIIIGSTRIQRHETDSMSTLNMTQHGGILRMWVQILCRAKSGLRAV
jgi:hypothetical protein